jgi:hypothetical protein
MNDIQDGTWWGRTRFEFMLPWLWVKWTLKRQALAKGLAVSELRAREIEKKIQVMYRKRDEAMYRNDQEESKYMRGFCDGIEYCLKGAWHD